MNIEEDDWWRTKAYETAREKLELLEENNKLKQAIRDLKQSTQWKHIPSIMEHRLEELFEMAGCLK